MDLMERRPEGPQSPYEVYCYHCHASFAVGTRSCVHCGRRMGRAPARATGIDIPEIPEAEAEALEPSIARRLGGVSLWVLLALGAGLMRLCGGN